MIAAAGLGWTVEQHPLEAVLAIGEDGSRLRVPVPRHVANVRSDTRAVLGVVGEGYEPLQNRAAFAFCDAITDSGRAHWIGAGSTRGGARVHALMRLDREIRIGGAEGEDVLPLLCFRNGHDGGLAVTVSVAPFRLACLNGMLLPLADAQRTWKARHTAQRRGAARRRAPHARDRLALLRRAGGARRAADPRARSARASSSASSPGSCRCPSRRPTAATAGAPSATPSACARRSAPPTGRRPTSTTSAARAGARCRPSTAYVDHDAADAADGRPHARRGALRARDRAAAAQGPSARTADRRRDQLMTATLSMVPLAKIKPSDGFNPRSEFADEQMAELVESVKRHGIITPLTLAPDGDGRLHDHRRASAATGRRRRRSSARYPRRCATATARR